MRAIAYILPISDHILIFGEYIPIGNCPMPKNSWQSQFARTQFARTLVQGSRFRYRRKFKVDLINKSPNQLVHCYIDQLVH